jgi:hypothetical protein
MAKKFNLSNAKTAASNSGKIGLSLLISASALNTTFVGLKATEIEAKTAADWIGYKVDPKVYKVKKGFVGKSKKVTVNPVTGAMKDYKGDKKPENKKAFRI